MLLAVDAGNSFVKLAYHDGTAWQAQQRIALTTFFLDPKVYFPIQPQQIIIANVAGPTLRAALESVLPDTPAHWVKATPRSTGVTNLYDSPEQLGADRWAMLIAAHAMTQQDCAVISCGTALTVDLLAGDGKFMGGVIAPGIDLMRTALLHGTHAVQPQQGQVRPLPKNTADAVETGLVYAVLGVIERAVNEYQTQMQRPISLILTGGAAHLIAPYLNRPAQVVDNLVLEGLRLIAREETSL